MTTLYLLLSFLWAWTAFNLYYPIYDNARGATLSFIVGWPTGELALHVVACEILLTVLFVMGGAITGFFGALALLIAIASWAAMSFHYLRSDAAADEIEVALLSDLGVGYADEIANNLPASRSIDKNRIAKPFPLDLPGVEVLKDISFGTANQRLDIYRPYQTGRDMPVLLQIHGGAWTEKMGSKNEQARPLMNHMALRNWICVSIDYRLSPTHSFPDHVIDCKEGLAWVRTNIAQYGGDPDFIVLTGGSAGGHLSSLLALTANDPLLQPGFEDIDTSVKGCVPFYGVYDLLDENQLHLNKGLEDILETSVLKVSRQVDPLIYRSLSPLHRIHENAPPFLIIQGDSDSLVSVEEARLFADKLRKTSRSPVCYAEISGAQHAFDMFPSVRSEHVKLGVERFLEYLKCQDNNQDGC